MKFILVAAMAKNRVIGKNNGLPWDIPEELADFRAFTQGKTILMGRKTYDSIMAMDMPFPYPDKKNYVFSRTQQQPSLDFVRWINDDVVNFVKNLKQQEGKDIWLIGGGTINTLLLNAQLIDEIQLALVPIFLGEGIPLFEKPLHESTFAINKIKHCHTGLIMLQLLPRQLST